MEKGLMIHLYSQEKMYKGYNRHVAVLCSWVRGDAEGDHGYCLLLVDLVCKRPLPSSLGRLSAGLETLLRRIILFSALGSGRRILPALGLAFRMYQSAKTENGISTF